MNVKSKLPAIPAEGFEIYADPCYYDMIALRKKGETSFDKTIHFMTRNEAIHASYVIADMIENHSNV